MKTRRIYAYEVREGDTIAIATVGHTGDTQPIITLDTVTGIEYDGDSVYFDTEYNMVRPAKGFKRLLLSERVTLVRRPRAGTHAEPPLAPWEQELRDAFNGKA